MIAKTTVRRAMLIGAVILAVVVLPAAYAWFTSGAKETVRHPVTKRPASSATTIEAPKPEPNSATPAHERPAPRSRKDVIKTKVPLTDLRQENVVLDRPAPDPPPETTE